MAVYQENNDPAIGMLLDFMTIIDCMCICCNSCKFYLNYEFSIIIIVAHITIIRGFQSMVS